MGLHDAGWDVTGVDLSPQPRYPFRFVQANALTFGLDGFDLIWASPPCQAHVSLRWMYNAKAHVSLIEPIRQRLRGMGIPYVIENVPSAPLLSPVRLCGTAFNLGTVDAELWRHRHFEASFPLVGAPCRHRRKPRVIGVYGGHGRDRRRSQNGLDFPPTARKEAMGIDWMTSLELSQAIPPVYSSFIARQLREP